MSIDRLQATTVTNLALGFIATLLAVNTDPRAAYLILAAAFIHIAEEVLSRRSDWGEFSKRMGSLGALVAFGIAPSVLVLKPLLAVHQGLLFLPVIYLLSVSIWLTRYDISRRLSGMPVTVNGFVIPALLLTGFFTAPIVAGWLILASGLMAFEIRFRDDSGREEYVVKPPESSPDEEPPRKEDDDEDDTGFIPLSDM